MMLVMDVLENTLHLQIVFNLNILNCFYNQVYILKYNYS